MPTFAYEVKQPTGQVEKGTIEGVNAEAAARALQAKGYFVVTVRPVGTRVGGTSGVSRNLLAPIFHPVNSKSLAIFFTSLRALLSAGMNISEAMHSLARQTSSPTLKQTAREMSEAAEQGRPMSSVLGRYPSAFNETTIAILEAGEQSGMIEQTADRIARHYDRIWQLEQSYRWQTFYPKILLAALIVIPTVPTLVLGSVSAWIQQLLSRALPLVVGIMAVWYGWRALRNIPAFAAAVDGAKLMVPWFGSLARRMAAARWARALAALLSAGVPVHRAMLAAAAASGNSSMEQSLVRKAKELLEGRSLTEVVVASRVVPPMAVDLLSAAEKSGSVEDALDKVAEYYESETEVGGKQTAVAVGTGIYLLIAALIAGVVIKFWLGYFRGLEQFMP
jgi:type IV pilus assembly protein PilC